LPGRDDPNTLCAESQPSPGNVTRVRKLAALAVLAFALAGCGGNGSAPNNMLTAAQWRWAANELCREIGPEIRAVPRPRATGEILPFTAKVIPLWKREEDRLRALAPPTQLATPAEELADALSEVNVALLEIHIATQRNDGMRRYYAVQRSDTAARGVKLRSRALGLAACARQRVP
jgi:hypothetical protein